MTRWILLLIALIGFASSPGWADDRPIRGSIEHSDLTKFVDNAGNVKPIQTVDDWEQRRAQILKGMQKVMGSLPSRPESVPFDIQVVEQLDGDGFHRTSVTFAADKTDRIPADIYYPQPMPKNGSLPAILALHPTGPQGKRIVAGDGPRPNRQYAVELAQRGYIVIAPDYPSFGDYPYDFNSDDFVSGTMKGIFNHMRCVDLLSQEIEGVDADRIGVIGHSLGGHNAMFAGAFDRRLKVIVSSCGWTPFHDYYGGKLKGWTSDRYMPLIESAYDSDPSKVPFDFYEVAAALAPRYFFSSSPKADSNFAVDGVRKAAPRIQGIYSLYGATDHFEVRYPDADHDFPTETRQAAYQFIDQALAHTPTKQIDYSAELPRIGPRSPDEAMKAFEVAAGFEIQQTASEPMVVDPVAMSFDEQGRLYVIEMRGYSENENDLLGRVRLLTDDNQDGIFDRSTVFAEELSWPTAIICAKGGVYVGAAPNIYFLKDNDADGKADHQDVIFTGFNRTNVQGLLNSFRWGLDQRIHGATSSSGGVVHRGDAPPESGVNLRGRDFSFDPLTHELRAESGGAQHGMSFDDWGRKYVCSNSDHAQMVMFDDRDVARNPQLKSGGARTRIADDGGQAPVFRSSPVEPWRIVRTRLRVSGQVKGVVEGGGRPAGYFTGATGITVYQGDAFGENHKGTIFVGDVGSNIVHRKKLIPDGAAFKATRIDEESEFVRSNDVWFRPVQFANGPDGCLHILDMYRETIEHPKSLPPEIKQHLDLTSGRDRGRLYRVVPKGFQHQPRADLSNLTTAQLVQILDHPNSWHRETASRLLYEQQSDSLGDELLTFFDNAQTPQGIVHGLALLANTSELSPEVLLKGLEADHPRIREFAVKLAKGSELSNEIVEQLVALASDPDARVRYELAFTSGALPDLAKTQILTQLLKQDAADDWVVTAAMSSLSTGTDAVFASLIKDDDFLQSSFSEELLGRLMQLLIRQKGDQARHSLAALTSIPQAYSKLQGSLLLSAITVRPALRDQLKSGDLKEVVERLVTTSQEIAQDSEFSVKDRVDAIEFLRLAPDAKVVGVVKSLLDITQPQAVQITAVELLEDIAYDQLVDELLSNWSVLSPGVKLVGEEALFSRTSGAEAVVSAIEKEKLTRSEVSLARLQALTQSSDKSLQKRVAEIVSRGGGGNRKEVVERYQESLKLDGNPGRGRVVFLKNCSICHRLNGEGTEIGPNLATIQNRGAETILLNVLDPNREVNPKFVNYVVATISGKSHTGMIKDETATAITLVRAENKSDTILRSEIDVMKSTGLSIMPEGLEKEIDPQEMADLVSYLLSIQ